MAYYKYKESISHKTNDFPIAYYSVDKMHPRYEMMYHWHPEYELIYINKGNLVLNLDKQKFALKRGDFALIPSGVMHSGKPDNCLYECVVFNLEIALRLGRILNAETYDLINGLALAPYIYTNPDGKPEKQMKFLVEAMREKQKGFELAAISGIYGIFYALISQNMLQKTGKQKQKKLAAFESVISYIEQNYNSKITLKDMSAISGISTKYFGEYFKNITGKTPFEYLTEFRIERASEMLIYGKQNITDISLECGFNDLSYFTKTFKKIKGITPREYKNRC